MFFIEYTDSSGKDHITNACHIVDIIKVDGNIHIQTINGPPAIIVNTTIRSVRDMADESQRTYLKKTFF